MKAGFEYFDIPRHWTKRIMPHLKPREADCHRAIAKPEIAWQK